ncbi:MAG TPA: hypothetical protein VFE54_08120 [Mucilaginibacter sp.]|jgi:hypothetical protein|nr:hypothetical protein [Mucilaginibacter sp.]
MKKISLIIFLVPFILVSCKKEHGLSLKTQAKKHAVTFNVSNFKQNHGAFALRTKGGHLASDTLANLAGYIDVLYYVVQDSNNTVIKTIVQDSTMANLGVITDSLAAGNYSIAMVAGKQGLHISTVTGIYDSPLSVYGYAREPWHGAFWTSAYPNGYTGLPWQDTFWDAFPLTVGNQNINMTATLNRVVGKLEVTLLDAIPANADSLFIAVVAPGVASLFGSLFLNEGLYYAVSIPASAKGQTNFTVERLVHSNIGQYGVDGAIITITCKDAGGNVLGQATIGLEGNTIVINANQKTILSGNLFVASPSQSFTAVADTTWGSGGPQIGFSLKRH